MSSRSPAGWKVELTPAVKERLLDLPRARRRRVAEVLDRLQAAGPPEDLLAGDVLEVTAGDDRLRCRVDHEARRIVVALLEGPALDLPGSPRRVRHEEQLPGDRPGRVRGASGRRAGGGFRRAGEAVLSRILTAITSLAADVRAATRSLRVRPGFAVVTFLTLALGLAANAAIFGLVHEVVLQPLPFAEPGRLVVVESVQGDARGGMTWADYLDLRDRAELLAGVTAISRPGLSERTVLSTPEGVVAVEGRWVDAGFFEVLGVEPELGTGFTRGREVLGEVVLGHGAWERRWGGDPGVLGTTLTINGEPRVVRGILPQDVDYGGGARPTGFWLRAPDDARIFEDREAWILDVVARLGDGVTLEAAREEIRALAAELAPLEAERDPDWGLEPAPLHEHLVGDVAPVLWMMLLAAGALILIICTNLAGLAFARNTARRRELAMRMALGAGRGRVVRQLVLEVVMVALAGGVAGLAAAPALSRLALDASPVALPRLASAPGIDPSVAFYTLSLAVLASLLFSLAPAWRVTGRGVESVLRGSGRALVGGSGRRWILAVEAGLVVVMLVGAGLALRSFVNLARVDPGFEPEGRLVFRVSLSGADEPVEAARSFLDAADDRLRALPGVRAAGSVTNLPLYPASWSGLLFRPGEHPSGVAERPMVDWEVASPGYFEAAGIRLLRGRVFDDTDRVDTEPVTVVNEALARRFFPDGDALGEHISGNGPEGPWRRIVGVVENVRQRAMGQPPEPHMFVLHQQMYAWPDREMVVATEGIAPEAAIGPVREVLREIDPAVVVDDVRLMSDLVDESLAGARFGGLLLTALAGVGLLLGLTGVYAVVAWFVEQRVRELGVRMALGAGRVDVLRLALGRGLLPVIAGSLAGAAAAAMGASAISGFLYEVSPLDPSTYGVVVMLLCAAAAVAAFVPARRAAHVDPAVALGAE